jgi:signal transduction histidine kinase
VYRYRLQEVIRLQNIRNKIAGDLHDDIGSTLNSISIFSQVALQDPAEQKHALEMIGDSSRKIIESMSDIVWTINPENDNFQKIIFRMRSLVFDLLRAKNIEFTFRADDSLNEKKLTMEERRNFYLIFKEAINNIVKYAKPTKVSIQLSADETFSKVRNFGKGTGRIVLLIRDNGVGFDLAQRSSGNGLKNMQRRAREMNAELKIESGINQGTSVELILKT